MIHFLIDLKRTDKLKILKISQMMDNYVLHNFVFVSEMIRWSPGPQIDEKTRAEVVPSRGASAVFGIL